MKQAFTKFNLLFIVCVCFIINGYSQGGGMIWYFGHNGGINFSSGTAVAVTNGQVSTTEGSSSISDCHGNLLSYTEGQNVYDATHTLMPNGTGLTGGWSSSQSALYVPKPCSKDTFYLFTAAAFVGFGGISYNILDMTQNSGKGDIVSKNNVLDNQSTERLTGIKHANGIDYWVITHDWQNNNFIEYKVTNAGISAPITIPIGNSIGAGFQYIGVAKFSPNGKKMAVTVYGNGSPGWVDLYDFNTSTGMLSNRMVLDSAVNLSAYGASFSPDNSLLYVATGGIPSAIYQFNLSLGTKTLIAASKITIGTSSSYAFGHLQLGPDGKIYAALGGGIGCDSLGVIKNPNVLGIGCNYVGNGFYLGGGIMTGGFKRSSLSLPTTIESYYDTAQYAKAWPNSVLCIGNNVQLHASGGTIYKWTPVAGLDDPTSANPVATPAATTTYTVSIYDPCNSLCDTIKKTVTVTVNSCGCSMTVAATNTSNVNCNGAANGSASVTISSGSGGTYTYNWSSGTSSTTTATTLPITNLSAATYTVTITDGACTSTSTVTITQPAVLSVSSPSVTNATCGNNNGSLTLATPTGGTSGYTYLWSNGATTQNITSLAPISYTVTVTDANSCSKTTSATISNSAGPTITSVTPTNAQCFGGTGSAAASASGGTGTLTYSWNTGATSPTVSNLISGTYTITVTDANNCPTISTVSITAPTAVTASASQNTVASCGISNGIATTTASGGSGTFTYSWSSGATTITASGLAAGTYTVTVHDQNNCSTTTSTTISNTGGPTITSISPTNAQCFGGTGSAAASASGGTGTLTYSWNTGATSPTVSNVVAGTYIISVTDASGCLTQSSVMITQPTTVTSQNANSTNSTCGNNNGSTSITATGGTGSSYTYSWNTGATSVTSGQSTLNNLIPNTYTVTITDQNNCSYTHTFTIGNQPSPTFMSPVITPVNCKGNNTGQLDVLISSSSAPYTYSWSNGPSTITIAQNNTQNNLPAGSYSITITDNNGCNIDTTLTLTEPTFVFTSTVTATSATCITGGSATATIAGGNAGNYTYSWSNGASSVSNTQLAVGNNLPAGNYTITVTDSKGCSTISTTTINAPTLPTVMATQQTQATCNSSNGVAAAIGSGGSGSNYTYSWSNSTTGATANNLSANNYTVTITDGNGCTSTSTVAITNSNGPSVSSQNATGTCIGNSSGSAAVAVAGGTGPYTYSWSNGASSTTSSLNHLITSLLANTYTVTITDNNNCTITTAIMVTQFPNPTANAGTDQTITSGTSIQLTASGGTNYLWTPASTLNNTGINNPIANPTQTTTYIVTVTDANSCTSTDDITITVTTPQTCNASEADEFVANVFSPNGDGRNDVLFVKGSGLTNIYFAIYNRWGQKLFETTDQTKGWDGMQNGKPIDEQTVVYYLKATCITTGENIVKKGDVSVVR